MNWQTIVLVVLVVLWAAAQYGLAAHALLDLNRRPTVRGNNKVVWALVILGIPIAGALFYTVYGPTSFIRRSPAIASAQPLLGRNGPHPLPPDPEDQSAHSGRAPRFRQHSHPAERLPDLPELADFDDEIDEPAPRRAAHRLVRQAQRKIRR